MFCDGPFQCQKFKFGRMIVLLCRCRFLILLVSMYQMIFSIAEILFLKLDKLLLTAVSFLRSEENVFPANFVTP